MSSSCPDLSNELKLTWFGGDLFSQITMLILLDQIYFNNTPHGNIAELKADQGWMNQAGDYFEFPGGGTMFPEGAERYVQTLGKYIPIGTSQIRTALDIGCGVRALP